MGIREINTEACMAGEIIRLGDSTSHGGTVIEGSQFDTCMGKPIAYVGHRVRCPKCKGIFSIVEGAQTTTFYGKGVALAGMRTACGAVLIASQFTDTVTYGIGAATTNISNKSSANSFGDLTTSNRYDDRFILLDEATAEPLSFTEYAIRRASGKVEYGTTDANGHTHLLSATLSVERVKIYA
jgi:uncharacterized Zn-binding protein involved in type VI secretion